MSKDAAMTYAVAMLGMAELEQARASTGSRAARQPGDIERARRTRTLYLNGAPLAGIFPISALAHSIGLNVTLTSYHDHMDFGFVGNGAAMYDLPSLALQVGEAYEELKAAAAKRRPARGPGKRARVAKARRTRQ